MIDAIAGILFMVDVFLWFILLIAWIESDETMFYDAEYDMWFKVSGDD